jgi:hypothetical protein
LNNLFSNALAFSMAHSPINVPDLAASYPCSAKHAGIIVVSAIALEK